jgi:hypothetical protein
MSVVNKVVDLLKSKNYGGIKTMLNPDTSFINYNKSELISKMEQIDGETGIVKEFLPYGFYFNKLNNGREVLHISGILVRDKRSTSFSVDIDITSQKDEILVLQYKL